MQLFPDLTDVHLKTKTVLTIGTFDGLHKGHQHLIRQIKQAADKQQALSAVISFHPRPKTVLAPHLPGNDYLTTSDERIGLFEALGVEVLVLMPFTVELSQTTAYNFIALLVAHLNPIQLWAGPDFALGRNREGNVEKLTELGRKFGYTVHQFEPFFIDDEIVSSTRVRNALHDGNMRLAACLLGRFPSLRGDIVRGDGRGRTIGFPTANFAMPPERLIPANGVYATFVERVNTHQRYRSVTNVGVRPSFGGTTRTVETFIFDFDEDIYGETLNLEFVARLRPEKKFNGIDELIAQIAHDSEQARAILTAEIE